MHIQVRGLLLGLVLSITLGMLTPLSALAETVTTKDQGINLTTSPIPYALVGKPGQKVQTDLKIKNSGKSVQTLKVGLMKFTALGEDGKPQLLDRGPKDDYFDWVSFSESQFTVNPGEWHTITMTVDLPPLAAFGYYYAATFSPANPPPAAEQRQTQVRASTAVLVLVEASVPNAVRHIEVVNFSVGKHIYEFLPASFNVRLANTGNIHLIPTGNIFIYSGKKQIGSIPVNQSSGNMLPSSKRVFTANWVDGSPVYTPIEKDGQAALKDGKPDYKLKWDAASLNKLRIGKYTAHLFMTYDNGKRDVPLEAYVTFWVIPWRLIGLGSIPLILAIILIFSNIRLRSRVRDIKDQKNRSE